VTAITDGLVIELEKLLGQVGRRFRKRKRHIVIWIAVQPDKLAS
jgi:hypothetical protein